MKEPTIVNPVVLAFDPATCDDEEVREIFADDVARTLWLGIRPWYLCSEYFGAACLNGARVYRLNSPATAREFAILMRSNHVDFFRDEFTAIDAEYFEQLWPFVTGESTLTYFKPGEEDTRCPKCDAPAFSFQVKTCRYCGEIYCLERACKSIHETINCYPVR